MGVYKNLRDAAEGGDKEARKVLEAMAAAKEKKRKTEEKAERDATPILEESIWGDDPPEEEPQP